MDRRIWKPIAAGIIAGTLLYFLPFFFLRGVLFFFVIAFVFRLLFWRKFRGPYHYGFHPAFMDSIRKMNDEEYEAFKRNWRVYERGDFENKHTKE